MFGVCGLGNTGSFAVIDLLREYDEIFYDESLHEFSLCYYPDGLSDLEYHLVDQPYRFMSSDAAISRFENLVNNLFRDHRGACHRFNEQLRNLSKQYIEDITQVTWSGNWSFSIQESSMLKRFLAAVLFKGKKYMGQLGERLYISLTSKPMHFSVRDSQFGEQTKNYVRKMVEVISSRTDKKVVIDQAFPGDNPERCFKYFDDPYAIVVDRDPRDLYILSKCHIRSASLWIPTDNVENFIKYYYYMRSRRDEIQDKERVLYIKYEDLIYEYKNTVEKIEDFCHITKHSQPNKYFRPEISINNTQLFYNQPNLAGDIKKIEKELGNWLYPFEKYDKRTQWNNVF